MIKKNVIILVFMTFTLIDGFENVAVGVVIFGFATLIQEILDEFDYYKKIKKNIPGPSSVQDKFMRWIIADFLELAGFGVYFLLTRGV